MPPRLTNLALSSTMHLLVDGVCACTLFLLADTLTDAPAGIAILAYNIVAFMTQPLTGAMADRRGPARDSLLGAAVAWIAAAVGMAAAATALGLDSLNGCDATPLASAAADSLIQQSACGVAASWLPASVAETVASWLPAVVFVTVAVTIGIGNSLFHVWGGKQTATDSHNDIRQLGVFVATGGMGLVVGILYHAWWLLALMLALLCIAAAVQLRLNAATSQRQAAECQGHAFDGSQKPWRLSTVATVAAMAAIMAVVLLRSYYSETFAHGFRRDAALSLAIAAVATMGKASGGWIERWLGIGAMAAVLAVGLTACACLRTAHVGVMLAGIFLINTTMPVTLWMANRLMPGREGMAFGLLAAVLVPGYLLAVTLT